MELLEKQIDQELKRIDPDLYLDKHYFEGHIFWTVRYRAAESREPFYVMASPELNWNIVNTIRMNEGDITEAIAQVKVNNAVKREEAKRELYEQIDEAAEEHNRSTGKLRRWYIKDVKPI